MPPRHTYPSFAHAVQFAASLIVGLALPLTGHTQTAFAVTITDPGQAPVTIAPGPLGGSELSAIAFQSGSTWRLASDNTTPSARVFGGTIEVDPATGHILGTPTLDDDLPLAAGADTEGLALVGDGSFFVSDEVGPAIRKYNADGSIATTLSIPPIFSSGLRGNLGFESLALGPDGSLWTANEEALTSDGPVSSFTGGTIVRIQRFDPSLAPSGQWGYVTEDIPGNITGSGAGRDIELSGVVDMAVLPSGSVLVLERAFGGDPAGLGFPIFEIRIFAIDVSGATDTSSLSALTSGGFTPVSKELLWEGIYTLATGLADFEGLAIGPPTNGGDLIALLVADDNGGSSQQVLKALIVTDPASSAPESSGELIPHLRVSPNPAVGQVQFQLPPKLANGSVDIFDASGRRRARLPAEREGRASWSLRRASPGLYFARVAGRPNATVKFTVVR